MDNYFACVNPDCLIFPKVLTSLMDQKKHISPECECRMVEMVTIHNDVIADLPFFDLFTQNELNQHLSWANESLVKIHQGFEQFFGQLRTTILKQINDNFIEIHRLYELFSAVKNQDVPSLKLVRGDLSSLVDQCKVTDVLQLLQKNQTNIYIQLKEIEMIIIQINNNNYPIQLVDLITSQPQWWVSQKNVLKQSEYYKVTYEENKEIKFMFIQGKDVKSDVIGEILESLISIMPCSLNVNYYQQFGNKINDIKTFAQIKFQTNLTTLKISLNQNQITDIKPMAEIKSLTNLTTLEISLSQNQITDIKPMAEIKSLTNLTTLEISLSSNQITDIKPIAELKSLTNLTSLKIYLWENQITDIKPIAELKSLTNLTTLEIHLNSNQITDIKPMAELKSLTKLTTLEIQLPQNLIKTFAQLLLLNQ